MQTVVILPENEYKELIQRIEVLEKFKEDTTRPSITFYSTAESAKLLRMTPAGLRKARLEGRIKGQQRNGKEWEFSETDINKFLNRYKRDD